MNNRLKCVMATQRLVAICIVRSTQKDKSHSVKLNFLEIDSLNTIPIYISFCCANHLSLSLYIFSLFAVSRLLEFPK